MPHVRRCLELDEAIVPGVRPLDWARSG
jgi:hypothetical protein